MLSQESNQMEQRQLFMALRRSVKDCFKQQILKEPKLAQFNNVLCKWFKPLCSKRKLVSGPMIIKNATYFYEKMKITY